MRTCPVCKKTLDIRRGDEYCLECGANLKDPKTIVKSKYRVILVAFIVVCLLIATGAFFVSHYYESKYAGLVNQYNSLSSQHNSLVSKYNSLVTQYNSLVKTLNTR